MSLSISIGELSLEDVAKKMVDLQSFDFKNFQEARRTLEFKRSGMACYIEFDCITLYRYNSNLSNCEYHIVYKNLEYPLRTKLSNTQQKVFSEYHALRYYLEVLGTAPNEIIKREHPDFEISDETGEITGVEIVKLTPSINQLQNSISRKYAGQPLSKVGDAVRKELGKYSDMFKLVPVGQTFLIMRKEATSLAPELDMNTKQLSDKYWKYKNQHKLIEKYHKFIVLGEALTSEVAIVNKFYAKEVITGLKSMVTEPNVLFVVLFRDHEKNAISVVTT